MSALAVITGASRGIGRETALRFARGGYRLVLAYRRDAGAAAAVAEECRVLGSPGVWTRELDLEDPTSIAGFARETAAFGETAVLVNNAGVIVWKPLSEQQDGEIGRQIGTNLVGVILLTRELLPHVRTVLNVGSDLATFGMAQLTVYCAAKFGLRGFTQALALEHPELRVLCVNPDRTATGMNEFQGRDPATVAEVIWRAAEGQYDVPSGGDVNVWEVAGPL
ncbi:MAG TPA: SDR family oxidoreductase [Thermoanaerobaculia bacterium]|jgi:NAD(P)-dependent dehydrogenase (short-subunit alcohol dehydrogenase family)|nr:SDR family oxidoreductase [Thermoanaerobaculia bacterium]